jgi:transketolase
MKIDFKFLERKAEFIRRETLRLHQLAPGTRLASSLSPIEILTVLYYGNILKVDPKSVYTEDRDRFIISKAHGSISLYPILADFGFFDHSELDKICQNGALLGSIPDPKVPGYETINGSLGQGLGIACGISIGLSAKKSKNFVFVLLGDGELYEGSVWEGIMFASEHKLDNLVLIIDSNKACMLDYCKNIINLEPLEEKFHVFGWYVSVVDGHDILELYKSLLTIKNKKIRKPRVIIADTVKGKGVPRLENDPLSHIRVLSKEEIDNLLSR